MKTKKYKYITVVNVTVKTNTGINNMPCYILSDMRLKSLMLKELINDKISQIFFYLPYSIISYQYIYTYKIEHTDYDEKYAEAFANILRKYKGKGLWWHLADDKCYHTLKFMIKSIKYFPYCHIENF